MKHDDIFNMDTYEFLGWIDKTFTLKKIEHVITMADMNMASEELLRLSALYSYISELVSYAKVKTREIKRSGNKIAYEDMVDKKDALDNKMSAIKQSYAGISRAVSIKIENNTELRMTARSAV